MKDKKKTKWVRYSLLVTGILLILVSLSACEDTRDDLLDRDSAGVWVQYNSNNSDLPGNSIIDIELDKQGDLWVSCSGKGVTRYHDGIWTTYNTLNCTILNDTVTVLEATNDGRLLAGTVNGLAIRSPGGEWSSFKDPEVPVMHITSIKEASDGTIWIGTYNQGYYLYFGSSFLHSTTREDVFAFEEDPEGNLWLGASFGLAKFNGTAWSYINTSNGLPDGEITELFVDSKERLWISVFFNKSVFWLDINNSDVNEVSLMNGMSVNFINDIYEDKRGDIWIATFFCGLIRYDGVVSQTLREYNGFYENYVNCIGEDKSGNMWFGLDSKGLIKYTVPLE